MINPLLWWYICATLTTLSVSLYYHRSITHRSITLHPVLQHFFRLQIWLTVGIPVWMWVAVHRWHHQYSDKENDIHSPKRRGFWNLVIHGYSKDIEHRYFEDRNFFLKYSVGAPQDWMEKNIYTPFPQLGLYIMLVVNIIVCGVWGPWVWIGHYIWKGVITYVIVGVGHHFGYQNYNTGDESRNNLPWGIIVLGEELHNNHHQNASSPNFNRKWFEIDLSWYVIKILCWCKLCKLNYEPQYFKENKQ